MKRITSLVLSLVMLTTLVTYTASAESSQIPTSFKAPEALMAYEEEYSTVISFGVDSELLKFIDSEQTDHEALGINSIGSTAQIDWKLNDGDWHYTPDWDDFSESYGYDSGIYSDTGYLDYTTEEKMIFDLRNGDETTELQSMLGDAMISGENENGDDNRLDLENNTFYFKVRFVVNYFVSEAGETKYIYSPWSEVLAYGKDGASMEAPTYLETPTISNPVVGTSNSGSPIITFTAVTPEQVQEANIYVKAMDKDDVAVEHQININNTGWIEASAGAWWLSGETRTIDVPVTYDNGKIVKIDEAYIQIRMRYTYDGGTNVGALTSDWSNIVAVNTPAWESASTWATTELEQADDYNLIPDILKGKDLTKYINREEFAELAVLLYEQVTKTEATPVSPNPFKDTNNPQILKAVTIGVTHGTSDTTFSPAVLITREQCAAMLFRDIQAIDPKGDYNVEGVADFPDQGNISSYAVQATKYMSKLGIIKGNSKGYFMPKATTDAEKAVGFGMATREAAIIMAKRTFEEHQN